MQSIEQESSNQRINNFQMIEAELRDNRTTGQVLKDEILSFEDWQKNSFYGRYVINDNLK